MIKSKGFFIFLLFSIGGCGHNPYAGSGWDYMTDCEPSGLSAASEESEFGFSLEEMWATLDASHPTEVRWDEDSPGGESSSTVSVSFGEIDPRESFVCPYTMNRAVPIEEPSLAMWLPFEVNMDDSDFLASGDAWVMAIQNHPNDLYLYIAIDGSLDGNYAELAQETAEARDWWNEDIVLTGTRFEAWGQWVDPLIGIANEYEGGGRFLMTSMWRGTWVRD